MGAVVGALVGCAAAGDTDGDADGAAVIALHVCGMVTQSGTVTMLPSNDLASSYRIAGEQHLSD